MMKIFSSFFGNDGRRLAATTDAAAARRRRRRHRVVAPPSVGGGGVGQLVLQGRQRRRGGAHAQPPKSLFMAAHLIDYIWPQFYPSPAEITMNGDCWSTTSSRGPASPSTRRAPPPANRCRVGIGVPFAPGAANGGQIASSEAVLKLRAAFDDYPILGAVWRDVWLGRDLGPQAEWGVAVRAAREGLASRSSRSSAPPTPVPSLTACARASPASMPRRLRPRAWAADRRSRRSPPSWREPNSVVYYGRDYTNGGMAVSLAGGGTEWQPYCGCTRVGRTAFTSALECADEWAAQLSQVRGAAGDGRARPGGADARRRRDSRAQVLFQDDAHKQAKPRLALDRDRHALPADVDVCDEMVPRRRPPLPALLGARDGVDDAQVPGRRRYSCEARPPPSRLMASAPSSAPTSSPKRRTSIVLPAPAAARRRLAAEAHPTRRCGVGPGAQEAPGELTVRASLWVESPIDDPTDARRSRRLRRIARRRPTSSRSRWACRATMPSWRRCSASTTRRAPPLSRCSSTRRASSRRRRRGRSPDCPSIASDNQAVYDGGYAEGEDRRGAVLVEHHRCGDGRRSGGRRRHARVDHRGCRD